MQEKYWLCRRSIGLQEAVLTMKEDKDIMRAPGHCTVTASHRIMVEHSDATRSSMLMEHPSGSGPRRSLAARAPSTEGQADMLMVQPASERAPQREIAPHAHGAPQRERKDER